MKKLFVLLLLVFTTICYSQTNYVRGFDNGYKEGYCHDKGIGCIEPIPPIAPIPKIGESSESYNDGYNRGFEMGLQANNNSSQTQQPGSSYIVHDYGEPQSMFDTDLAIYALAAKQRQYEYNQQARQYNQTVNKETEYVLSIVDRTFQENQEKLKNLNDNYTWNKVNEIVFDWWNDYESRNANALTYSNADLIVSHINRRFDDAIAEVNKKHKKEYKKTENYRPSGLIGGYTSDKITEYKWNPTTKKYDVTRVLNIDSKVFFADKYYAFKRGNNPWKSSPWSFLTYDKETGRNFFYDSYGQNLALHFVNHTVTWYMDRENGVWTKAIVYENLTPNHTVKPQ